MSSIFAIIIVATVYVAALGPLAFAAWKPNYATLVASLYVVFIGAIGLHQSGLFAQPALPSLDDVPIGGAEMSTAQCAQLLAVLDEGGVIVDRRSPPRLVVAQGGWGQLPAEAREAVVACVQRTWPRGVPPAQVEARS
jgi:hypothetical protein